MSSFFTATTDAHGEIIEKHCRKCRRIRNQCIDPLPSRICTKYMVRRPRPAWFCVIIQTVSVVVAHLGSRATQNPVTLLRCTLLVVLESGGRCSLFPLRWLGRNRPPMRFGRPGHHETCLLLFYSALGRRRLNLLLYLSRFLPLLFIPILRPLVAVFYCPSCCCLCPRRGMTCMTQKSTNPLRAPQTPPICHPKVSKTPPKRSKTHLSPKKPPGTAQPGRAQPGPIIRRRGRARPPRRTQPTPPWTRGIPPSHRPPSATPTSSEQPSKAGP